MQSLPIPPDTIRYYKIKLQTKKSKSLTENFSILETEEI